MMWTVVIYDALQFEIDSIEQNTQSDTVSIESSASKRSDSLIGFRRPIGS